MLLNAENLIIYFQPLAAKKDWLKWTRKLPKEYNLESCVSFSLAKITVKSRLLLNFNHRYAVEFFSIASYLHKLHVAYHCPFISGLTGVIDSLTFKKAIINNPIFSNILVADVYENFSVRYEDRDFSSMLSNVQIKHLIINSFDSLKGIYDAVANRTLRGIRCSVHIYVLQYFASTVFHRAFSIQDLLSNFPFNPALLRLYSHEVFFDGTIAIDFGDSNKYPRLKRANQ